MNLKQLDLLEKLIELVIVRMHSEYPNMQSYRENIDNIKQAIMKEYTNDQK